jgi:hypothetical protein
LDLTKWKCGGDIGYDKKEKLKSCAPAVNAMQMQEHNIKCMSLYLCFMYLWISVSVKEGRTGGCSSLLVIITPDEIGHMTLTFNPQMHTERSCSYNSFRVK